MKTFSEYLGKSKDSKGVYDNQRQAVLLAYLAGIVDGEGTIRINKCTGKKTLESTRSINPKYAAYIGLGMVEKVIPDLFCKVFNGSVREERVPCRRSIWRWTASGRFCVQHIARILLPYLIIKRPQAELVIKFCEEWNDNRHVSDTQKRQELQRREETYWEMRKLNAVGAAATTERESNREIEATVWTCGKLQEES